MDSCPFLPKLPLSQYNHSSVHIPAVSQDTSALNIILQPGVAFGTGEHPTTSLCLRYIHHQRSAFQGAAVMDYGTGSGVLAILALRLGA